MAADPERARAESPAPDPHRRVAIFGGSFNPPHIAHVLAVAYALSVEPIDAVLVVPVFQHPFAKDKELAPFEHRLEMCRLALGWMPHVAVSTVERELGGASLTLRTLEHLKAQHPDWGMRLLVGADVLPDLPKWHRFERVAAIAPLIVLGREGFVDEGGVPHVKPKGAGLAAPAPLLPRVSSTEVREAIAAGDDEVVRARVPRAVVEYIAEHNLYGGGA